MISVLTGCWERAFKRGLAKM